MLFIGNLIFRKDVGPACLFSVKENNTFYSSGKI